MAFRTASYLNPVPVLTSPNFQDRENSLVAALSFPLAFFDPSRMALDVEWAGDWMNPGESTTSKEAKVQHSKMAAISIKTASLINRVIWSCVLAIPAGAVRPRRGPTSSSMEVFQTGNFDGWTDTFR